MSDEDAERRQKVLRKLYQATALCSCFFVVEVAGGLISHSLAVLSDAAHLLADLTIDLFVVMLRRQGRVIGVQQTPNAPLGLLDGEPVVPRFMER